MDLGSLRHLKHMQIRKPLQKSSLADPSMTEEEVNMKFVQDLLNWVEEMQVRRHCHVVYDVLQLEIRVYRI